MNNVLVTGGGGFIGSFVVDNLRRRGIATTVFDYRERESHMDDVDVFLGDVRDRGAVVEAVGSHDGVIHLAGLLGTQETLNNPGLAVDVNTLGSLNVFEACEKHDKPGVYISVGNYWMNNPYAISKSIAERFALMYNRELGTKITVVRGYNIYGPHQKSKPVRKVVPTFVLSALNNDDITIFGTGNQIMDMIYVEDVAEILVRALIVNHGVYGNVMEAGMGLDTTINDLAATVVRECESDSKIIHTEMRPGEEVDSVVKADVETLSGLGISLNDMTTLEMGIKNTVRWYRDHPNT